MEIIVLEAVRGQKTLLRKQKKNMKEWIFWKMFLIKVVHDLKNSLVGLIRFDLWTQMIMRPAMKRHLEF